MATSLEALAVQLAKALEPLRYLAASQEAIERSLNLLGWETPPGVDLRPLVGFDPTEMLAKLEVVLNSTEAEEQDLALMARRHADLLAAVRRLVQAIDQTAQNLQVALAGVPDYLERTQIVERLPRRAGDLLLAGWIGVASPPAFELLRLLGLIQRRQFPADASNFQVAHTRTVVDYDRLQVLLSDPVELLVHEYGWGTAAFEARKLVERIAALALAIGFRARFRDLPSEVEERLIGVPVPDAAADPSPQVDISLTRALGPDVPDLGLAALRLRPGASGASDAGLGVLLYLMGTAAQSFPLSEALTLEVATELDLAGGVLLELRPTGAAMKTGVTGDGAGVTGGGRVTLALRYHGAVGEPIRLLSIPGGTRLEAEELAVQGGATLGPDGTIDPMIEIVFGGGRLIVTLADADGFLAQVLPRDGLQASFELGVGWSQLTGLHLRGATGLEATLPVGTTLGPLSVPSIFLRLHAADGRVRVTVAGTIRVRLGPVQVAVERIGLEGDLTFPAGGGNLGPAQLVLGFKPPDGAGLAIEAPGITGGGYLSFDQNRQEYAGIVQLSLAGYEVTGVGLLTTGPGEFSLLVIISTEFAPVQLGFGFTLNGVGGLFGVNRRAAVDVLRAGLRTGSLDSVLFPRNPIENAPRIVSDAREVFPPAVGRYVFGPMAILGYGSPPLIEAELGVILELPDPIRLVILGQATVTLPRKGKAIVELHLDVLGVVDFGAKLLSIDARLHNSRISFFNVFGDMALRLFWGVRPNFALAIGGLHPRYRPPPGFPELRRLTVALGTGTNPRLTLQAYLALTSNTLQFGARAELYAEAAGFNLYGWVGFDALFSFSPFSFMTEFTAGVALRHGRSVLASVEVAGALSGPSPWRARGKASVSLLFFRVTVEFDATFAREPRIDPSGQDPWVLLKQEISKQGNWSAELPPAASRVVALVRPDHPGGPAGGMPAGLIEPVGGLALHQRIVPLDRPLTKFGQSRLSPPKGFLLESVEIGQRTVAPSERREIRDLFAPAQFEEMTDAEKLSRPSFELMTAGLSLASDALAFGSPETIRVGSIECETITLTDSATPTPSAISTMTLAQQLGHAQRGLAPPSPAAAGLDRFHSAPGGPVGALLEEERFEVVASDDLSERTDILAAPATSGIAARALASWLANHPQDLDALEVVPVHERVGAP